MQNESRETILSEARSSHVSPEGCFNRPPFAISRNHHHGDWQKVRTSDLHHGLVRVESRQALPPAGRGIRYTVVQKCASEQLDPDHFASAEDALIASPITDYAQVSSV